MRRTVFATTGYVAGLTIATASTANAQVQYSVTTLPASWPEQLMVGYDISNFGEVVGELDFAYRPFLYANGSMTDLLTLAGYGQFDIGTATGINDNLEIAGIVASENWEN